MFVVLSIPFSPEQEMLVQGHSLFLGLNSIALKNIDWDYFLPHFAKSIPILLSYLSLVPGSHILVTSSRFQLNPVTIWCTLMAKAYKNPKMMDIICVLLEGANGGSYKIREIVRFICLFGGKDRWRFL